MKRTRSLAADFDRRHPPTPAIPSRPPREHTWAGEVIAALGPRDGKRYWQA